MDRNIGKVDKAVRVSLGVAWLAAGPFILQGPYIYLTLIGLIPLFTGMLSFCPLYKVFGICTRESP